MDLKDNRVNRMLRKASNEDARLFYGPVTAWFVYLLLFFSAGGWLSLNIFWETWSTVKPYFPFAVAYLLISFITARYLSNSFALTSKDLLIINPNFPFRRLKRIPFSEIRSVEIRQTKKCFPGIILGIFYSNFIVVDTARGKYKFYCFGLEEWDYDGNWTDETLDDFESGIRSNGVAVYNFLE